MSKRIDPSEPLSVPQLLNALRCVFEALDRVSGDPRAVIPWRPDELVVLHIARGLLPRSSNTDATAEAPGKDGAP